jgi:DNA topoisomerase-2
MSTVIEIDEIPIGYDLNSYIDVLDGLKDAGIIRNYEDQSENDIFKFLVKVSPKAEVMDEDELLNKFKLVKRVTEIFTCIDENNRVIEFKDEIEIIKEFVRVKLEYIQKRKDYLLNKYSSEILVLKNKCKFIKGIQNDTIVINKKSTTDVIAQLELNKFDKQDDSYNYLLNLNIHSLTNDKYLELKKKLEEIVNIFKVLRDKSIKDIYLDDIKELEVAVNEM